jgi:CxxC motif-containing protein (DUF1111 family)
VRVDRRLLAVVLVVSLVAARKAASSDPRESPDMSLAPVGKELFVRNWIPHDPRSRDGDGLGPVYNATSCVACHHVGGTGGAGFKQSNVQILTPFLNGGQDRNDKRLREILVGIHPDFATKGSIVLHRFGLDARYAGWRAGAIAAMGPFRMTVSERNTPPLFGAGLIDAIPDDVIEARAIRVHDDVRVRGRVSRLQDGQIGRFGWKGQAGSLRDFVRGACAVELGLEVPGRSQGVLALAPDAGPLGLDLSGRECEALAAYVASLPRPTAGTLLGAAATEVVLQGRSAFESVGCNSCHVAKLGDVDGLYSDLLLHDMGPGLGDAGAYYGNPLPSETVPAPADLARAERSQPAGAQEWRTPPLWGLRDSAPYLHDGRASNVEEAITAHGGEAQDVVKRYSALKNEEKKSIRTFLLSLSAPARGGVRARR